MSDSLEQRIARIAADRESGASEILDAVIGILRDAIAAAAPLQPVAQRLVEAQPSMAPVWNAVLEVYGADDPAARLDVFAQRVARAPTAIARFGRTLFLDDARQPLHLVTLSFSRSTLALIDAIAPLRSVRVSCSEGRPALEGRRLAAQLDASGVPVTFYTDAALGQALEDADAVITGADAVSATGVLNKSGTRMLAASASLQGIPTYVVASRDKFVSQAVAGRLRLKEGQAREVWESPPARVAVRNPYFETIPLELVATLITDMGLLPAAAAEEVCAAIGRHQPVQIIYEC